MKKNIAPLFIAFIFVLSVFPSLSLSAADHTPADGDTLDISTLGTEDTVTISDGFSVTLTGTAQDISIYCGENVTLTIADLIIDNVNEESLSPITFMGTGNNLILIGESTLNAAGSYEPGITVQDDASLTIGSTTNGTVTVIGGGYAAGIGTNFWAAHGGTITIESGTVYASGGEYGSGIGGGYFTDGGNITISGGTVNASGGEQGSGIGGGPGGGGGSIITISDGTVNASGGEQGSGIGGGRGGGGGIITISGGTINANGGYRGSGIGGGWFAGGGNITISGGIVTANGGDEGAGIGGGWIGSGGIITISGGAITSNGGEYGAGIGGGYNQIGYNNLRDGGTITLSGGSVTANGGDYSAGIGGGYNCYGGTITISGGTITSNGGEYGSGIGGGYIIDFYDAMDGDSISISGGIIFAASGNGEGLDIGHGAHLTEVSLALSGRAAVFLRHDKSVIPSTTTHTHEIITALENGSAYGILMPSSWTPDFGAYLNLYTLSFSENGGSGTLSDITGLYGNTVVIPDGNMLIRDNYSFSGWNTTASGSGTLYHSGSHYTLEDNQTLYAQWTAQPALTASPDTPIMVGESITLTPNISGGTWDYDSAALTRDGNTFTPLVAGTFTLIYTVDGQSVTYVLSVQSAPASEDTDTEGTDNTDPDALPRTGDTRSDTPALLILLGLGLVIYFGLNRRARKINHKNHS